MLRGVLVGFGVSSLFGMPSQSAAITITFWVFAFWLWSETTAAQGTPKRRCLYNSSIGQRVCSVAAAALIAVHVGMTTVTRW